MIYRQTGFKSNVLKAINTNKTALETLTSTIAPTISQDEDIKQYKANNMLYFISGEIQPNEDGSYTRNDSNLKTRNLIVIDIEDTGLTSQEVQNIIQEKLSSYKYLLYSTISHKQNNPRLRLVLEPSRDIVKDEYKPTIQHVIQLLNIEYDTSSCTWSQLQGLPIAVCDNEFIFIKHLDGLPYPVQEAVKEEKKVITTYTSQPIQNFTKISHNQAISIMEKYVENEQDKLLERNDYYLSCLTVIAKSVVSGEIEYDTAIECMELLALNNDEWKVNNLNELNGEITRSNGNIDYFKNKYTFLGKFQKTQQKIKTSNALTNASLEITTDEKGKVIQTLENLEKIILSITPIAYNELTDVIEIKDKQGKIKPLEKRDKELFRMEIEKSFKFKAKVIDLDTAIVSASDKCRYHPIKNQITSIEWDKTPRAETFFIDVLGVEDNVYNRECTRKWLLASLTRLFNNGVKFDEMIILQGGQGIGKSTTLQRLSLGYYTDITEKISDEVTFKVMRTWLVELSELSTMMKTDSDSFKAWLSASKDTVRKKYGSEPDDYPRTFTVLGTTNNKEILKDRTGNRRYWLMYCEKDKIKSTIWNLDNNYILQLWGEVYQWYKNGENLLISEETKQYMEKLSSGALDFNPLEERINSILDMYVPNDWKEIINDSMKRYEYYNHVNEYTTYGKGNSRFPLQTQIMDITTGELVYLLGNGEDPYKDLKGDSLAKEINQVMNDLPNWIKSNKISRSHSGKYLRGFKRKLS
ncbi:virulence-associated E family protein [Gemella haemolysans]|uniref:virulence-associated E family protein n=1 Tax=Gemella haemolysans TaxID=1379 RepID=UPI00290838FA|nr:virulence-associated E family protein [Gemella haemolysans]MDU3831936.1 virulence-associated E family protein [Gemella haemolysans]